MEVSEESIRLNNPIPPLPKFDLKNHPDKKNSNSNLTSGNFNISTDVGNKNISIIQVEQDNFTMTDDELKKYTLLFEKNKDLDTKITVAKAYDMWNTARIPIEKIKKILTLVPLKEKTCFNFNEFKVIFHLIYKTYQSEVPNTLPNSLKVLLEDVKTENKKGDFDFSNKLGMNLNLNSNTTFPNEPIKEISSTNKSVDIESALMNEFNIKPVVNIQPVVDNKTTNITNVYTTSSTPNPNSLYSNSTTNQTNNLTNQTTNTPFNFNNMPNLISSNNSTANTNANQGNFSFFQSNVDKMNNIYAESIQQNSFLTKTLEEDNQLLKSLMEETEKINKNIFTLNEKNKELREQITEIRRRINIEKDNLSKAVINMNMRTTEFINIQGI
jgi:hypothetical protein